MALSHTSYRVREPVWVCKEVWVRDVVGFGLGAQKREKRREDEMSKEGVIVSTAIALAVMASVAAGYTTGYNKGSKRENIEKIDWRVYDRGFKAGEGEGYNKGFLKCYSEFGQGWFGHHKRFRDFVDKYGSIHSTPWREFSIQEKLLLCAFGSPGNKLSDEDMQEVIRLWGGK